MKRLITLFLALIMLVPCALTLVSCADTNGKTSVTVEGGSDLEWIDNLPADLNFSEESDNIVTMLVWGAQTTAHAYRSVIVDEASADAVDQQLFKRNQMVERRLGVEIEGIHASDTDRIITSSAMTALSAGTDDYDVVVGNAIFDIYITLQDVLLDLNTLEQYGADYIDLSQPYWPGDYLKEVNYKDKMWWLTGDITTSYLSQMQVIFVNGELYEKYLFQTYGSFYDVVKRGDWTLDMMNEMSDAIFMDTGDKIDENDETDINGLLLEHACADIYALGAGIRFSTRDADGAPVLSIVNDNTIKFMEKYFELKQSKGTYYVTSNIGLSEVFKSGNGLFVRKAMEFAESDLREMNNFYVVPVPKLEKDAEYRTRVGDWVSLYAIPKACNNYAMAAATLEALASASYSLVTPVYYDEALKYKYTRDDDAAEMIDIIRDSTDVDFALMYGDEMGTGNSRLGYFFRYLDSAATMSQLQASARMWNKLLGKLITKIDELS